MAVNTTDVGELFVKLKGDLTELEQSLDSAKEQTAQAGKEIEQDWSKIASKMNNIGKGLTVGVTMPIIGAGVASVKMASDVNETMNKIDVVFGKNSESIKAWADTSITSMGLAGQSALDSAALFGDMGTSMGLSTDMAAGMAVTLTQLSSDLASFKNIRQDVATTALNGIYSGETESLKQLGVVMTVANLEQYAMEQGIKKVYGEMTQAEKVQLRYAYVIDATSKSQGDFANTSDGTANQMRMVLENAKQLGASIGQDLLPEVNKMLVSINGVTQKLSEMNPASRKAVIGFALVAASIGPLLMTTSKLITATQTIKGALEGFKLTSTIAQFLGLATAETASATAKTNATIATTVETIATEANTTAQGKNTVASVANAGATTAMGTASAVATPAVSGLAVATNVLLGPVGIIAGLMGAVGIGIAVFGSKAKEASTGTDEFNESVTETSDVIAEAESMMADFDTGSIIENLNNAEGAITSLGAEAREQMVVNFTDFASEMMGTTEDIEKYMANLIAPDSTRAEGTIFALLQRSAIDWGEITSQTIYDALEVAEMYLQESLQSATDRNQSELALLYERKQNNADMTEEMFNEELMAISKMYDEEQKTATGHYDNMIMMIDDATGGILKSYEKGQEEIARINKEKEEEDKRYSFEIKGIHSDLSAELERIDLDEAEATKKATGELDTFTRESAFALNAELIRIKAEHEAEREAKQDEYDIKEMEARQAHDESIQILKDENDAIMLESEYIQGQELNKAMQERYELLSGTFNETFGTMPDDWEQLGIDIALGLIKGLDSKQSDVDKKIDEYYKSLQRLAELAEVNSPSKYMMRVGQFLGDGLVLGMENRRDDVGSISTELGKMALQAIEMPINSAMSVVRQNSKLASLDSPRQQPITNYNINKSSSNAQQNISYTSKPMSRYEQIMTQRQMSRQLASSLNG